MDSTFSQELLHILQFYYIDQKFTPILMLINAFAMLAGSGGAPRAAIFMGKKDNDTAE